MKLLRSWPATVPEGRNYIVDSIERLVIDGYDYSPLADVGDDVLLIEWDMAVSEEDLRSFASLAAEQPGRVLVAPYRLYRYGPSWYTQRPKPLPGGAISVWAHRVQASDDPARGFRHIETNEPACHYFGLGLAYLPKTLLADYQAARGGDSLTEWGFSDGSFSAWHWRTTRAPVPVAWDIRPVHLHYDTSSISREL